MSRKLLDFDSDFYNFTDQFTEEIYNTLKNEVEKAFVNKKAAAMNSELAIATMKAIRGVNKVVRLSRKFNKPSVKQELKDAGAWEAAQQILTNFQLNPNKDLSERDSYAAFVKKALAEGEVINEIPERLM